MLLDKGDRSSDPTIFDVNIQGPMAYIGSFAVVGEDQNARADYVRTQLVDMKEVKKSKEVLLVVSLSGIKVCSSNGESVYMAHALKRISYATCDPDNCQFSFLAREPKGQTDVQYCHAFITHTPSEAEELNTIVGNAFKMAYAYQRQAQGQPTFQDIIAQQLKVQEEEIQRVNEERQKELNKKLSRISTATIADRVKERKEKKRQELEEMQKQAELERLEGKDRVSWAKHIAGRAKHKSPHVEDAQKRFSRGTTPPRESLNCDKLTMRSLSLQEAFDSPNGRKYGSPVMALKENIDRHFSNSSIGEDCTDGRLIANRSQSEPANQKDPLRSDDQASSATQSPRHSALQQRPLPATPTKTSSEPPPPPQPHPPPPQDSPEEPDYQNQEMINGGGGGGPRPVSCVYRNSSPTDALDIDIPLTVGPGMDGEGTLYQGPPTPARYDSLARRLDGSDIDDPELRQASWYQAGIPRDVALDFLSQQEIGSFLVRDSTTHPGCYALSVKVPKFDNPTGISHYLILRSSKGGFKLKGLEKEWSTLSALVTHHTVMPEMLPCTLRLPRTNSNLGFNDSDREDKDEDEDYQKFADFSTMMRDLKM